MRRLRQKETTMMIAHVSIGVRDIAKAKTFYDAALAPIGYTCLHSFDGSLGYGREHAGFWVNASESPVPPDPHSGLHFCFTAPTRESVDAFHRAALGHGGHDNGKPGRRADYGENYYAAFAVDPDGYRIEAYCDKAG
jgi:catechol 2,3-dioxygenase-like lactoylglutathione lyase family enzyme